MNIVRAGTYLHLFPSLDKTSSSQEILENRSATQKTVLPNLALDVINNGQQTKWCYKNVVDFNTIVLTKTSVTQIAAQL